MPAADTRHHLLSALTDDERKTFEELGQIDLAYTVPGVARFRGNIYLQQRGVDGAFRIIPDNKRQQERQQRQKP